MTAAQHTLMVFLLNRTMAKTEKENAVKLHSQAATPDANAHRYTLQRYCGVGGCVPMATRTAEVKTMSNKLTATSRLERRRLMRKMRISLGIDTAIRSAKMVNPLITPATSMITVSMME